MVPLEKETNIEVIRQMSLWMRDQIEALSFENRQLKNAKMDDLQTWLDSSIRDQLLKLQERFYSRGRESLAQEDRPQGHKTSQLNLHGEHESPESEAKDLPVAKATYNYLMSDRQLAAESLLRGINAKAEAWEKVEGLYQSSTEITVIEKVYQQTLHQQQKYRLKRQYNDSGKEVFLTAPGPAKLRPGSRYSIDFATNVAIDKYLYHMPLERQRRQMASRGLNVEVKTLYGLCEAVAEHCQAVVPMIKQEILGDFTAVHVDETPWHIIGEGSSGYMWVLSNRIGSFYQFEPTRSGKVAEEILEGYVGGVVSDGYAGYSQVKKKEGIRHQQCWSHVRREFFDIEKNYPRECLEIIRIIDKLFDVEASAKSFEDLRELRKTESKKVIKEIYDWLEATQSKCFPESGMKKAINYTMNAWHELTWFLNDLSVPLTNNDAERALRHVVMGRKNFNGSKTINGADTASAIYTVVESAKKAGLEPILYLKYLIDARWFKDELKTPQQLAKEKYKSKSRIQFPPLDQWKIN